MHLPETYVGMLDRQNKELTADLRQAHEDIERLKALLNTPEVNNFVDGVVSEAQHQRVRWGLEHDRNKSPADWFWLIGYLAQKAMTYHQAGNFEKAKHHIISTAAAMALWHEFVVEEENVSDKD